MNDRLKFRLWDKGNEHYVVRADLFYIKPSGEIICGYYDFVEDIYYCEQNDVIVERCTGLKDKNGKLIFEGDIIRSENFFGIVEFGKYRASYDSVNLGFYIKWGKKQSELRKDIFYWHETYGLKVVGNIHEDIDEYIGKHNIEREEE